MKLPTIRPASPQRRILVVDDETFVCSSLKMVLRFEGHIVETTTSPQVALELFAPGKFDLVIVDYAMPGMTGDELAATLKARAPQQPIVLITAYGDQLTSQGVALNNVDCLLLKPFSIEALRQAIARLVPSAPAA